MSRLYHTAPTRLLVWHFAEAVRVDSNRVHHGPTPPAQTARVSGPAGTRALVEVTVALALRDGSPELPVFELSPRYVVPRSLEESTEAVTGVIDPEPLHNDSRNVPPEGLLRAREIVPSDLRVAPHESLSRAMRPRLMPVQFVIDPIDFPFVEGGFSTSFWIELQGPAPSAALETRRLFYFAVAVSNGALRNGDKLQILVSRLSSFG